MNDLVSNSLHKAFASLGVKTSGVDTSDEENHPLSTLAKSLRASADAYKAHQDSLAQQINQGHMSELDVIAQNQATQDRDSWWETGKRGVKAGLAELPPLGQAVAGMGVKAAGDEVKGNAMVADAAQGLMNVEKKHGMRGVPQHIMDIDPSDVEGLGLWLVYNVAKVLPTQIPIMLSTAGTGTAATLVARQAALAALRKSAQAAGKSFVTKKAALSVAKQAAVKKAGTRGAMAGGFLAAEGLAIGEVSMELMHETGNADLATTLAFSTAIAALDTALPVTLFKQLGLGHAAKKEIIKDLVANGTIAGLKDKAKKLGVTTVKGMFLEGGTEGLQTVIEKAAVKWIDNNKDVFTVENWKEVVDSMAAGGGFGGGASLTTGVISAGGDIAAEKKVAKARELFAKGGDKLLRSAIDQKVATSPQSTDLSDTEKTEASRYVKARMEAEKDLRRFQNLFTETIVDQGIGTGNPAEFEMAFGALGRRVDTLVEDYQNIPKEQRAAAIEKFTKPQLKTVEKIEKQRSSEILDTSNVKKTKGASLPKESLQLTAENLSVDSPELRAAINKADLNQPIEALGEREIPVQVEGKPTGLVMFSNDAGLAKNLYRKPGQNPFDVEGLILPQKPSKPAKPRIKLKVPGTPKSAATEDLVKPEEPSKLKVKLKTSEASPAKPVKVTKPGDVKTARKRVEPNPSEAQIEAGNYRKGYLNIHGTDISIETPKGGVRAGRAQGRGRKRWKVTMPVDYGQIQGTKAPDGDPIDVFLGPDPTGPKAFVINQKDVKTGKFDEPKVMIGFKTPIEARNAYNKSFTKGFASKVFQNMRAVPVESALAWAKTDQASSKPFTIVAATKAAVDADVRREFAKQVELSLSVLSKPESESQEDLSRTGEPEFKLDREKFRMTDKKYYKVLPKGRQGVAEAYQPLMEKWQGAFTFVKEGPGTYRVSPFAPLEQVVIAETLEKLEYRGMPAAVFKRVNGISANPESYLTGDKACYYPMVRRIEIDAKVIDEALSVEKGKQAHDKLVHYLAHEYGHALDIDTEGVGISENSVLFGLGVSPDGNFVMGDVLYELAYAHATIPALQNILNYPFNRLQKFKETNNPNIQSFIQLEAFAQLHGLWHSDRKAVRKHMPAATALMERIDEALQVETEFTAATVDRLRTAFRALSATPGAQRPEFQVNVKTGIEDRQTGQGLGTGQVQPGDSGRAVRDEGSSQSERIEQLAKELSVQLQNLKIDGVPLNRVYARLKKLKTGNLVPTYQKLSAKKYLTELAHDLAKLAIEGKAGWHWYEKSSEAILDLFGGDKAKAELFVQLIAIYSPQNSVPSNLQMAITAWNRFQATGQVIDAKLIQEFRDRVVVKGLKTKTAGTKYLRRHGFVGAYSTDMSSRGISRTKAGYVVEKQTDGTFSVIRKAHLQASAFSYKKPYIIMAADPDVRVATERQKGEQAKIWRTYKVAKEHILIKTKKADLRAHMVLAEGIPFDGRKTNNFYINLMRVIDPEMVQGVTSDLWMARAFGFVSDTVDDARKFDVIERITAEVAEALDWGPHQVQAAIWVAMKARQELMRPEILARAKKKGLIKTELVDGKQVNTVTDADKYAQLTRDITLGAQFKVEDFKAYALDFSSFLSDNIASTSIETVVSEQLDHLKGLKGNKNLSELPYQVLAEHQQQVMQAFLDAEGNDVLAGALGLTGIDVFKGPGYWGGKSNPMSLVNFLASGAARDARLKPEVRRALTDYIYAVSLFVKQDGVGWIKPFHTAQPSKVTLGNLRIFEKDGKTPHDLTPEEMVKIGKAIDVTGTDWAPMANRGGVFIFETDPEAIKADPAVLVRTFDNRKNAVAFIKTIPGSAVQLGYRPQRFSMSPDGKAPYRYGIVWKQPTRVKVNEHIWETVKTVLDSKDYVWDTLQAVKDGEFASLEDVWGVPDNSDERIKAYARTISQISNQGRAKIAGVVPDILTKISAAESQRAREEGLRYTEINEDIRRAWRRFARRTYSVTQALVPSDSKVAQASAQVSAEAGLASRAQATLTPATQQTLPAVINDVQLIVNRMTGGKVNLDFKDIIPITNQQAAQASGNVKATTAAGMYDAFENLITIALGDQLYDPRSSAFHEAFHSLETTGVITPEDIKLLDSNMDLLQAMASIALNVPLYSDAITSMSPYEVRAVAFQYYADQKRKGNTKGWNAPLSAIWNKVLEFFQKVRNVLHGHGFRSVTDLFNAVYTGQQLRRTDHPASVIQQQAIASYAVTEANPEVIEHLLGEEASFWGPWNTQAPTLEKAKASLDYLRLKLQDRYLPVLRLMEVIEHEDGAKLAESMNPYLAEEGYTSRAEAKLDDVHEFREAIIEVMSKSKLKNVNVGAYLMAKHAEERNAQIARINPENTEGSGMSDEQAKLIIEAAEAGPDAAAYKRIHGLVQQVVAYDRQNKVATELWNEDTAQILQEMYPNYVPLKGWQETDSSDLIANSDRLKRMESSRGHTGQGFTIRGPEGKRATGRTTVAANILENLFMQTEEGIVRGEKNRVLHHFWRMAIHARENIEGGEEVFEIDKRESHATVNKDTGMVEYRAMPVMRGTAEEQETLFFKLQGQTHTLRIHGGRSKDIMRVFKNMEASQVGAVMGSLSHLSRLLSTMYTTLSPAFVVTNFFRDLQTALINVDEIQDVDGLRTKVLKDVFNPHTAQGIFRQLRRKGASSNATVNEWMQWFNKYQRLGGKVAFWKTDDLMSQVNNFKKELEERQAGPLSVPKAKRALKITVGAIESMNMSVENAVRLSVFKHLIESGTMTDQKAASFAKNLTVNFNRKGEISTGLNAIWLFFNATVQGTTRVMQHISRNPKRFSKVLTGMVATGFALDMLAAMTAGEDEDDDYHRRINEHTKRRNLVIPIAWSGDKNSYISIPLAYGYAPFLTLGRTMAEYVRGQTTGAEALIENMQAMITDFSPLQVAGTGDEKETILDLTPTLLRPPAEATFNQNFMVSAIMPPEFPGDYTPDFRRYFASVSGPSKWISETLYNLTGSGIDVSPESIDHVVKGYSGGMGDFVVRHFPFLGKNWQQYEQGEEKTVVSPQRWPFIRKVLKEESKGARKGVAYNRGAEISKAREAVDYALENHKQTRTAASRENLDTVREKAKPYLKSEAAFKALRKQLRILRKRKEVVRDKYSGEQSHTRLKNIKEREDRLINRFNNIYIRNMRKLERPRALFLIDDAGASQAQVNLRKAITQEPEEVDQVLQGSARGMTSKEIIETVDPISPALANVLRVLQGETSLIFEGQDA